MSAWTLLLSLLGWFTVPVLAASVAFGILYAVQYWRVMRGFRKAFGIDAVTGNPPMANEKEHGPWP